jgi:transcriptional regulator with XRE-family HTH domain
MMNDVTGELVAADRAHRKLSRAKYAALAGLTHAKVNNIEHGRQPTPDEAKKLGKLVFGSGGIAMGRGEEPEKIEGPEPVVLFDDDEDEEDGFVSVGNEVQGSFFDNITSEKINESMAASIPTAAIEKYEFKYPGYHISNSEIQTFKRCKRKWWLAYYRELRLKQPETTGPRQLGTRLHLALSAYYSMEHTDPKEVLESTIEYDRKIILEGTDIDLATVQLDELDKEADLARAMLEGYLDWVTESGADEGLEITGNEEVVEIPLYEGVVLVGKMDLRIRRTVDNARLFMDHKTVANLTSPVKTLHLDEQMLMYHLLEYLAYLLDGVDPNNVEYTDGGLYNMIRKVKRTVKANPPFFARVEVRHNKNELQSFYIRVITECQEIMRLRAQLDAGEDPRGVAYPTPTGNCSWDCDFIAVCPMFDDGSASEEMLASVYEPHDPHSHYAPIESEPNGE